jgi:flagellar hook assembly protein FlgD
MVKRLEEPMTAGMHEVRWDGRDESGRTVPSGMLFYEVSADGTRQSGRLMRLGR